MDVKKLFSLEGKVALITGGAYGIGYSIAKGLALAGAKIAFNCRKEEHMKQALENYKKDGIEVKGYYADVTKEEEVKELIAKIEKDLGIIDILVNNAGIIKRIPSSSFRTQKRNGKGVKTQGDITSAIIRTNTIDSLMVFTDQGRMYRILVNDIPVGTNLTGGQSIKSLIAMETNETPTLIYSIYRDTDAKYILFTTKNGIVKKTSLEEYVNTKKKTGIIAINLREGDSLASVNLIKDEDIIIITKNGMGIQMSSIEASATSRATVGVKGITLKPDDEVVSTLVVRHKTDQLAVFSDKGLGKKMNLSELPIQKRAGKGLIVYKPSGSNGQLIGAALVSDEDQILITGLVNSICISAKDIPLLSRGSIGNQLIKGNSATSVSKV